MRFKWTNKSDNWQYYELNFLTLKKLNAVLFIGICLEAEVIITNNFATSTNQKQTEETEIIHYIWKLSFHHKFQRRKLLNVAFHLLTISAQITNYTCSE